MQLYVGNKIFFTSFSTNMFESLSEWCKTDLITNSMHQQQGITNAHFLILLGHQQTNIVRNTIALTSKNIPPKQMENTYKLVCRNWNVQQSMCDVVPVHYHHIFHISATLGCFTNSKQLRISCHNALLINISIHVLW